MEPRFLFRAHAVAAGGRLIAPAPASIPLQAPLVLPVTGGAGTAESVGFQIGNLAAFDRASTRVAAGALAGGGWGTTSEVSIEGLSLVGGRVTVRRMIGRLTSVHESEPDGPLEGRIATAGTRIEGLRIDGQPVEFAEQSDTFTTLDTCAAVADAFARRPSAFRDLALREFFWGGDVPADAPETLKAVVGPYRALAGKPPTRPPAPRGLIACSVVSGIRLARGTGARAWGSWIGVPGVGRLQLGELLIGASYRRLTLLRIELDTAYAPAAARVVAPPKKKKKDNEAPAPDVGEMGFGGVETDGTPHP